MKSLRWGVTISCAAAAIALGAAASSRATGSLTVHVFDPSVHRLPDAIVRVIGGSDLALFMRTDRTDGEGKAVFADLAAGRGYKVEVSAEGHRTRTQRLVPITRSGEVRLSVRLEAGTDVARLHPLTTETWSPVHSATIETHNLRVNCPAGWELFMCPVSPCRCPHGYGAVEITVLDPDGVPMAGALFSAAIAGTHCFTHLEGDDTGKVRFESLVTDEPYDVVIVGGLLWAVETVTPKRGEVVQRVVRLSYPEGPLAVTVDACSIPLPGSSFGSNPTPLDRPRAAGPRMASAFIEVTSPDPWVVFPRKWTARP